ncbi:MAG: PEGA domain-containing protein [Candidatus Omnitrophica bacterium]|nr:PEGA domain-containing protein [Candidatus Omnitrophota bacterium]
MHSEQRIRAGLFYLSIFIFFAGLPFILSFSLGYKFDPRTFKFTKTGLIFIKTQPMGASVYMNRKLLNDKTPLTIRELLPGSYYLSVELEKYFPWRGEVHVEEGKVTRLERIILFPLLSDVMHLNKEKISSFWVDEKKGKIYYINEAEKLVYISNLEGDNFEEIGTIPSAIQGEKKYTLSPDREKMLCFGPSHMAVLYLKKEERGNSFILEYSGPKIINAFWYSDNYHIILVTDKDIEVREAAKYSLPVILVKLNKENTQSYYDENRDTIYFIDSQKASDNRSYDNVYKLELGSKFFQFQDLIKRKSIEKTEQN